MKGTFAKKAVTIVSLEPFDKLRVTSLFGRIRCSALPLLLSNPSTALPPWRAGRVTALWGMGSRVG